MAIRPPGDTPRFTPASQPGGAGAGAGGKPGSQGRSNISEGNATTAAQEAERDSRARIRLAEESARSAEVQSEGRIQEARDEYVKRSDSESARIEGSIESQKQKGYETLRELKNQQQAELRRTRREGDRDQRNLTEYYRNTNYNTLQRGEAELQEARVRNNSERNYIDRSGRVELDTAQADHSRQMKEMHDQHEAQMAGTRETYRQEYEKLREKTDEVREETAAKFADKIQEGVDHQQVALDRVNNEANQRLQNLRQDTATKLAAYSTRQKDPFYQMRELDAELTETQDGYILTATIPEHEQDKVHVAIRGDGIVVSGQRRNEEKLDLGEGRTKSTSSYQNFSESFALNWPVDGKNLQREFDGDQLLVWVPKHGVAKRQLFKADPPPKARAERPRFPINLPVAKVDTTLVEGDEPPEPSPKTKAGRTLA